MPVTHLFIMAGQMVLLVLSAFCSGSETALFSLTYNDRLHLRKHFPSAAAVVDRLLAQPRALLITLLMANMFVNVLILALGSVLLLGHEQPTVAAAINAASVIALIIFGDIAPKLLATSQRVRFARAAARPVMVLHRVLGPIRRVAETVVIAPLARLVGPQRAAGPRLTVDELSSLVELGAAEGSIARDEQQLLAQVVDLGTVRIRDVMAPRMSIHWLSSLAKPDEVVELVKKTGVTHIPVYRGSPDKEVLGMLDARRYLGAHAAGKTPRLTDSLSPVVYVPETARLDKLLPQFGRKHADVVLCVDEYGTIDGLVRINDIADRLVAKFAEDDAIGAELEELTEQGVTRLENGRWSVPGRLGAREWASFFGADVDPRASTVGGLVIAKLGRMAKVGDEVDFGNVRMRVAALRGNIIERLEVAIADHAEPEVES